MDKAKKKSYNAYIRGPAWAIKRQQALRFYGSRCMICQTSRNIQVHHISYLRFGGKETMSDLRVVCKTHHDELENFHYKVGKKTNGLIVFNMFKTRYNAIQKRKK